MIIALIALISVGCVSVTSKDVPTQTSQEIRENGTAAKGK